MFLASVVFSIEAEGHELWRSLPLGPTDGAQAVDLPLPGLHGLTLKATMEDSRRRA
jgi:hypothetical protein